MQLRCVAHRCQDGEAQPRAPSYRSVQWSADGTCLIANTYDHTIETIVVPADLLDSHNEAPKLESFCSVQSPDPINAVIGYPFFDLQDPATTLVLAAQRNHPIRLSSALTGEKLASYPLVNPLTEAYICPNALTFSCDGTKFIAGSESLISIFDVAGPGQGPLQATQTGPKKLQDDRWNPSTSIRGIVSALAIESSSKVLAAGTFSRQIGLYDLEGQGGCAGAFSIGATQADVEISGAGITQLDWSSCGRYLYIAERKSDGIMVYDIRNTGQLVSWCQGRKAMTNQRLGFDITKSADGSCEVWAGGVDGVARMWKDPQAREGPVQHDSEHLTHQGMADRASLVRPLIHE
jgi:telomerase Cajal body protein 1